jgi:O-antigen/teichoic acid export membrane protein
MVATARAGEGERSVAPVRARAEIVWGGVDQGFSSATNLGLSILAGRFLGAAGLGLIFLGFSAYLLVMSALRGFVLDPFVVVTAPLDPAQRESATRACMTLVFCVAIVTSVAMAGLGLMLRDPLGRGLLVFSPWIAATLIQDQWRSVLFRDRRGAAAALNDGVWLVGMVLILPFAWAHPSDWSVAAAWGGGAAVAALFGWTQVRLRPSSVAEATEWWRRDIRRLGWWFGAENLITSAGGQVSVFLLALVLTASDLGGIRVAQVVFAPMTLVGEAFFLPGVPIMTRALAVSLPEARRWAWRLGLGALLLIGLYYAVVIPLGSEVLARVFGPQFTKFTELVAPVVVGQIFAALALGFAIMLRADQRVHAVVFSRVVTMTLSLVLGPLFAVWYGVLGAVWGLGISMIAGWLVVIACGLRPDDMPIPFRSRI